MREWLKRLFHCHEYEIIATGPVVNRSDTRLGTYYTSKCKICGKIIHYRTTQFW